MFDRIKVIPFLVHLSFICGGNVVRLQTHYFLIFLNEYVIQSMYSVWFLIWTILIEPPFLRPGDISELLMSSLRVRRPAATVWFLKEWTLAVDMFAHSFQY